MALVKTKDLTPMTFVFSKMRLTSLISKLYDEATFDPRSLFRLHGHNSLTPRSRRRAGAQPPEKSLKNENFAKDYHIVLHTHMYLNDKRELTQRWRMPDWPENCWSTVRLVFARHAAKEELIVTVHHQEIPEQFIEAQQQADLWLFTVRLGGEQVSATSS